jgi:uncharacterized protein (TIGR00251 family)
LIELKEQDGAVTFRVRIQPRASKNEIAGEQAGALKLRLTAPPVENRANEECCRLLARLLDVPPSAVRIIVGNTSRDKLIRVQGVTAGRVRDALLK